MWHSERYKKPFTASSGVIQWLFKHKFINKSNQFYDSDMEVRKIIRDYLINEGIEPLYYYKNKNVGQLHILKNSMKIQYRWDDFKEYMFNLKKVQS